MNISEPFIKRPAGTSLLAVGLFVLGIVAYHFLPVAPVPRVDIPSISVSAGLPGADPETMASSVAAPLERRLSQISGVTELTSTSTLGGTSVALQFDLSIDTDAAARDVQAAVNAAAPELPLNLPSPPTYRKVNPADAPIMIMALQSSALPGSAVFELADEILGQKLSQIEGVSQVNISGGEKSAVRVRANPAALASAGLSLEDVRAFLGTANGMLPKGSVESDTATYAIYSNGQLFTADEYRNLIVAQRNGVPIRLGAIADVIDGTESSRVAGWAGVAADQRPTQRAVLLIIFKQPEANIIETVDRIKAVLPQMEKWIPPSVHVTILDDRTKTIRASVDDVQFSLLLSIALVVMVIFLFLRRFWPTFIASITVPLALAGTFAVMYLFHFTIDNLSLMAVTISVGFVVDDAIVVIENVFRFIEKGERPMPAALKGARQIGFTVVSMSLSLIAVFIPLLFMGGIVGRLFHEFAVTLSAAILVSGVISLTLTPMLCSRFLKAEKDEAKPGLIQRGSERVFNWMLALYTDGLHWVLRHQLIMLGVAAVTVVVTIWGYSLIPKGFFPQQDIGSLMGGTEASQDISFAAMSELQDKIANIVLKDPAVEAVSSFLGAGISTSTVNNGRIFVTLKPKDQRDVRADEVITRLRRQTAGVPGIRLTLQARQDIRVGGRGTRAQYQYALSSPSLEDLNHWVPKLMGALRKIPQIKDVNSDQQLRGLQTNVVIDRDAAARLGVDPQAIDNTLYSAFGERQVSTLYKRYNQHHTILEVLPEYQEDPRALEKIYVKAKDGKQVPLSSVAKFSTGNSSLSINHQGQFPAVTLSCSSTRRSRICACRKPSRRVFKAPPRFSKPRSRRSRSSSAPRCSWSMSSSASCTRASFTRSRFSPRSPPPASARCSRSCSPATISRSSPSSVSSSSSAS
jgi:multidrug efflux pump subunit AcrB